MAVDEMRAWALGQIDEALRRAGTEGNTRRISGQRYATPRSQLVDLRTRSFHPTRPPFFTLQAHRLADTDWFIFVWRDDAVVMPGALLRDLAPGLHRESGGGDYKPTFIVHDGTASVYAHGSLRDVSALLNAFDAIARAELIRQQPPG